MAEYVGIEGPYRTKKGYWVCSWNEPGTGKRRSRGLGSTAEMTRGEAVQEMLRLQVDAAENPDTLTASGRSPLVSEWLRAFLAMRPSISKKTIKGYNQTLAHMERVWGKNRRVDQVSRIDAKRLIADLEASRAAYTALGVLIRSRTVFAEAQDCGLIAKNPFRKLRVAASQDKTWSRPTMAEFDRVMSGWDNTGAGCVFALARLAGLRLNEAASATWNDVRWDKRTIAVHMPEQGRGQKRTTKKRLRIVPLEPRLHDMLWAEFERRGRPLAERIGGMKGQAAYHQLEKRLAKIGLAEWPDLMQSCRRMRLSEWAENRDIAPATLAKWAGNSVEVIMRFYYRESDDAFEKVTLAPRLKIAECAA